jgi:hypothetical protein
LAAAGDEAGTAVFRVFNKTSASSEKSKAQSALQKISLISFCGGRGLFHYCTPELRQTRPDHGSSA